MRLLSNLRRAAALVSAGFVTLATAGGLAAPLPAGAAVEPPMARPAVAIPAALPVSLTPEDVEAWLDGIVPALLVREGIVGASVAVVADGGIVTQRGFGWAEVDADGHGVRPVDPEATLFRIGSVSKLVVGTAVMQLVEEGSLDLDAPVAEYLDFDIPVKFGTPITLRHLLTHSAGFEDTLGGVLLPDGEEAPELREAVHVPPPQIFEPGTMPGYSNYSNALAAYVVERVSGQPFAEYADAHVFGPAGMETASFEQPLPAHLADLLTETYPAAGEPPVPFQTLGPWPAGSVSASGADMGAFMLAHLETESSPLLSPQSLETMHAPALTEETLGGIANADTMAISFYEISRHGVRGLSHGGDLLHDHADLWISPEHGAGIFVALNSTGVSPGSPSAVRELIVDGFADRYLASEMPPAAARSSSADSAAALAGSYELSRRAESTFIRLYSAASKFVVTPDGTGGITLTGVTDMGGVPLRFVEVEAGLWQSDRGTEQMGVRLGEDGVVEAIGMHPAFLLTPMSPWREAVVPALVAAIAILAIAVVAWPVRALVGVRLARPLELQPLDRRLRLLSLLAAGAVLVATALWAMAATQIMTAAHQSQVGIRTAQVLTVVGALGAVPAVWRAVRMGAQRRWWLALLAGVVALGFLAWAYTAAFGGLFTLSPWW
nr:beta-lactamase family protein [Actinomycetales bacterium]